MSKDRDFRTWEITPEQADKIANGDIVEMTSFYNRHLFRFRNMAYNYANTHNVNNNFYKYDVEEMLSQLFLDLPYLNWQNALYLTMSIKQISFAWSAYGGYAQRVAHGLVHGHALSPWEAVPDCLEGDACRSGVEDGDCLLATIELSEEELPDNILIASEERSFTSSEICERLRPILTEHRTNILQLYLEGYTFTQIKEKLGLTNRNFLSDMFSSFKLRYKEVLKLLYVDREVPSYLSDEIPSDFEHLSVLYSNRKKRCLEKARKRRSEQLKARASV